MKPEWRQKIADTISKFGCWIYSIASSQTPRFLYTIGQTDHGSPELAFVGVVFGQRRAAGLVNHIAERLRRGEWPSEFEFDGARFELRPVAESWRRELMLGARDYYQRDVDALQVVPLGEHASFDVPDMRVDATNGAWRFRDEPWPFDVPGDALVMVDAAVLRGARVMRVGRFEDAYFEALSTWGEVSTDDARSISLGMLVGHDPTTAFAASLAVGEVRDRDERGHWVQA